MAGRVRDTDDDDLDEQHEINITPFIDVMLVLLIIFMVAAPMLTTGVTVDLPNAAAPALKNTEDIPLLSVTEDRRIFLFDKEVALEDLAEASVVVKGKRVSPSVRARSSCASCCTRRAARSRWSTRSTTIWASVRAAPSSSKVGRVRLEKSSTLES